MLDLAATTLLAPALVAAATLAARRWGTRVGGVVSAFPAIVGPVLVIDLLEHGRAFAARAAAGTLLGLVALSAFVAAYGRLAPRARWPAAFLGAWAAAAAAGAALAGVEAAPPAGAAAAAASLLLAALALPAAVPHGAAGPLAASARVDLGVRMAACALLVVVLAAAASALGPFAGGMLAALPVLASVLAVFTHRREGAGEAVALLRGMIGGMGGFLAFCLVVAVLLEPAGPAAAFAAATAAALFAQLAAVLAGDARRLAEHVREPA